MSSAARKKRSDPACAPAEHGKVRYSIPVDNAALERAARLFRAIGDPPRLKILATLAQGEACVTELAGSEDLSTVSQRLRVLRSEDIVSRRRDGKHVLYALADQHVVDLIFNALAHASEGSRKRGPASNREKGKHS
jgi:DNA-binding transcriptional ArsR family regulator